MPDRKTIRTGLITLAALPQGEHRIRIEYYHTSGNAAVRIRWCGGGVPQSSTLGTPFLRKEFSKKKDIP